MPNLLGKTLFSGESVDGVIRFAHSAESAADSEGRVRLQHNAGDGVDIAEVDLDRGLVLRADKSVGGGALSWDVKIDNASFVVLHFVRIC